MKTSLNKCMKTHLKQRLAIQKLISRIPFWYKMRPEQTVRLIGRMNKKRRDP